MSQRQEEAPAPVLPAVSFPAAEAADAPVGGRTVKETWSA